MVVRPRVMKKGILQAATALVISTRVSERLRRCG